MPETEELPARAVVATPVGEATVIQKPWWSFGAGLYLETGDARYTVEPEPFYPGPATPGKIRRARAAVREFEAALEAAKGAR
ncbi:MAG: hypothetical protein GEU88_16105 [Solirubrobacterales bacterium]|nr:hypothetical protein [Solirubrobacterales bacterium]